MVVNTFLEVFLVACVNPTAAAAAAPCIVFSLLTVNHHSFKDGCAKNCSQSVVHKIPSTTHLVICIHFPAYITSL